MGEIGEPKPVTPIAAILASDARFYDLAREALEIELFGPRAIESDAYPFTATAYYNETMGDRLERRFVSFARPADPSGLADWKICSNQIERRLASDVRPDSGPVRPVNIDVGYLTGAKLVLASTKDFAHRIYLRDGIYAEITLRFQKDAWQSHPFTFPDFKSGAYFGFLSKVRQRHLRTMRSLPD